MVVFHTDCVEATGVMEFTTPGACATASLKAATAASSSTELAERTGPDVLGLMPIDGAERSTCSPLSRAGNRGATEPELDSATQCAR